MRFRVTALVATCFVAGTLSVPAAAQADRDDPEPGPDGAPLCTDPALADPVACVPITHDTFDIPFALMPGGRVDAEGNLDPTSSPEDAHAGAFVAAGELGLFGNFEWLHWLPTVPSVRDPETGEWSGGDLDGFPTGWGSTGLGIAGDCLYWGRSNSTNTTGPGATRDVRIFRIQEDPEIDPPVEIGTMPQLTTPNGETAVRDRELRPYNYTSTDGVERMLMVRAAATGTGGDVITYTLDPESCLPIDDGATAAGVPVPAAGEGVEPLFNAADLTFLQHMIVHHEQAVVMSLLVPERSGRPEFHRFADYVRRAQAAEIGMMQALLDLAAERGLDLPEQHLHDDPPMAGMLSSARMAALAEASGAEFERLWLEGMIFHHQGAIDMSHAQQRQQLATGRRPHDLGVLVEEIIVEQRAEIARMRSWLDVWGLTSTNRD